MTSKRSGSVKDYIYFDNNATIPMFQESIKSFASVATCGNVSAANPVAKYWREQANDFEYLLRESFACPEKSHELIWTSGSTESNCTVIDMFSAINVGRRAIICTSIEHKCLIQSVQQAEQNGMVVIWVNPDIDGTVSHVSFVEAFNKLDNEYPGYMTLVCCMHANNETGAINDIDAISTVIDTFRDSREIFFYSDCAQTAGKVPISMVSINQSAMNQVPYDPSYKYFVRVPAPNDQTKCKYVPIQAVDEACLIDFAHLGTITVVVLRDSSGSHEMYHIPTNTKIDGICFSGHKLGGPFGIGTLLISRKFLEKKVFIPITGAQNYGLRGGTYNMPGIIGLREAFLQMFVGHDQTVKGCIAGKNKVVKMLIDAGIPVIRYIDYIMMPDTPSKCLVVFETLDPNDTLPGTMFCSIVYNDCSMQVCNVKLKDFFEQRKIVLSIGSACNAAGGGMSHVLKAVHCPKEVALGILRISSYNNPTGDYIAVANAIVGAFKKIETLCITKKKSTG